jgi:hypothetical protein
MVTISGHVDLGTAGHSAAAHEVTVHFYWTDNELQGTVDTDASGNFTLSGLYPTQYMLHFDYNGTGPYYSTWYGQNPPNAQTYGAVLVSASADVANVNEVVPTVGSITGKVTLGTTGTAVGSGDVAVSVSAAGPTGWGALSTPVATDSNGNYTIPNLAPGDYVVDYVYSGSGSYQSAFYGPSFYFPEGGFNGSFVTVPGGAPTTVPMQLPAEGTLTGRVYLGSSATPAGLGDVTVTLTTPDDRLNPTPVAGQTATTDASGNYSFSHLNSVSYTPVFTYTGTGHYVHVTTPNYNDGPPYTDGIWGTGTQQFPDQVISQYYSITGHVYMGDTGHPATAGQVQVTISAASTADGSPTTVVTDANGAYTFTGLVAGYYSVRMHSLGAGSYADIYAAGNYCDFGNCTGQHITTADLVANATMTQVNSISGKVTNDSGTALAGVSVTLGRYDPIADEWSSAGATTTDANGNYTFTGLPDGQYGVGFEDDPLYAPQAYLDESVYYEPDILELSAGDNEMVNTHLHLAATLSGTVTAAGGIAADYAAGYVTVEVEVQDGPSGAWVATGDYYQVTLQNGAYRYSIPGLAPDNYKLFFLYYSPTLVGALETPSIVVPAGSSTPYNAVIPTRVPARTVAKIDSATGSGAGVTVSGYAVYPENTDATVTVALNIGSNWYALAADLENDEVVTDVPDSDPYHGFAQTIALAPGTYSACIWVSQPTGPATQVSCKSVVVPAPHKAVAKLEYVGTWANANPGIIQVKGYAVWPDSPTSIVPITVQVGSSWYPFYGSDTNTEVPLLVPGAGTNHGFDDSLALGYKLGSTYQVCVWAAEQAGGATNLGCSSVTIPVPGATIAKVDSVTASATGVTVSGYALFPGNDAGSVNVAVNIGAGWYGFTANQHSDEGATDVPGANANHGFVGTIALAPGTYSACVWVSEPTGPAVNTGCHTFVVPAPARTAYGLDSIAGSGAGVTVAGYALFPDSPASTVGIALNIGAGWYGLTANQPNTDSGAGTNHGYSGTIALAPGTYNVCVWVTEPSGPAVNTGCHTVVVPLAARAFVQSDSVRGGVGSVTVTGWDVFPDSLSTHVGMALNIGAGWYGLTANVTNAEVTTSYPTATADHGYSDTVAMAPGTYNVCIWTTEPSGPAVNAGCHSVVVTAPHAAVSNIDSVTGGVGTVSVAGWDVFPDSLSTQAGMAINIGANWYALAANTPNSTSASNYPTSTVDHGFAGSVALKPGVYTVCLWTTEPSGPSVNIGCRTATVTAAPPAVTSYDTATAVTGGIQVTGYSQYPGTPATVVGVAAQIGGNWFGFTANGAAANTTYNGHGFTGFIPASHGSYSVCLWTTEPAGAAAVNFGCKTVVVP